MQQITLSQMLANEVKANGLDEKLARLIETVAACGVEISSEVSCGALMGVLGMAGSENVQGEEQKKLDVISNDIVTKAVLDSGCLRLRRNGSLCGRGLRRSPSLSHLL